jgi:hypothetical protein
MKYYSPVCRKREQDVELYCFGAMAGEGEKRVVVVSSKGRRRVRDIGAGKGQWTRFNGPDVNILGFQVL